MSQGVSLCALLAAGGAHAAGGPFRSLNQAVSAQSSAAVASAAAGGGTTAAAAASLGARNLATAAARFRSLAQALEGQAGTALPNVPDGTVPGGLVQAPGVAGSNGGTLWVGANTNLGTQTVGGVTDITVTQTQSVADLAWQSFNIGAKTKLVFNQSAGGTLASSWVVINQVQDPAALPSTLLGQISAPGKVYVINRNGIAFGPGAQVNVGSLIAATADIAQSQFGTSASGGLTFQLYGAANGTGYVPTFAAGSATAAVTVAAGADIETPAPAAAGGGGYVMLLGGSVSNAGVIGTPQGQTILAAGTDFTLRPGYSPTGNATSTTLGSEIAVSNGDTYSAGAATNSGVIVADQGDITMVGHVVDQEGVVLSTTTVDQRGTVHLLTDIGDAGAQVILGPQSVTEILPEDNGATALDSQRAANIATSLAENAARPNQTGPRLNDTDILPDQAGEGRIEISTGGTVDFQPGALAIAQGGQMAVGAGQAIVVQGGATLDVSGTSDAVLPAAMNALLVNIQPYQLRDSAGNRNGALKSTNVYVDAQQLVEVASGAYAGNVYTPGGLLEVSGYLGLVPHGIDEWTAIGGQVTLQAGTNYAGTVQGQVITQPGSVINLTGGLVTYAAGQVPQSYVQTAAGTVYDVNAAPGDLIYAGIYTGQAVTHPRWHITDNFINPLTAPATIYAPSYVVGRDAGSLTIDAPTAVMQGAVDAGVTLGQFQTGARPASVTDPYLLAQSVVPLAGSLAIGNYTGGALIGAYDSTVSFQAAPSQGGSFIGSVFVPLSLLNTVLIDAGQITQDGFANISVATTGTLSVTAPVSVAEGGSIVLAAPVIQDTATITARGGSIALTNLLPLAAPALLRSTPGSITVAPGVVLDARGVWTNAVADPVHVAGEGFASGGAVTIDSTGGLNLAAGSSIDVSSGGALLAGGKLLAAAGGSVSLTADIAPGTNAPITGTAPITVASAIAAYGVSGGGTLSLTVPVIEISSAAHFPVTDAVMLSPGFFQNGFSSYVLNGFYAAAVAAGTQVDVAMPVYEAANAPAVPTGGDPASAYTLLLPALYVQTKGADSFTQRAGASLSLTSVIDPGLFDGGGGSVTVYDSASITVDPKQSITLSGYGQETVLGRLTAQSGTISVLNTRFETSGIAAPFQSNYLPGLSVWLGNDAVLDASGNAVSFVDSNGNRFGSAGSGGLIQLGIPAAQNTEGQSTYAAIVVRPGATLDVAGAAVTVDVVPGIETGSVVSEATPVTLAGNGGTISARSYIGVALDGNLRAAPGGAGAAGGSLIVRLDDLPSGELPYLVGEPIGIYTADEVLVSQNAVPVIVDPSLIPGQALPDSAGGIARVAQSQLAVGGFGQLALYATNAITFDTDVSLALPQAITLGSQVIGDNSANAAVTITAPYVALVGNQTLNQGGTAGSVGLPPLYQGPSVTSLVVQASVIDITNQTGLGGSIQTTEQTSLTGTGTLQHQVDSIGFASATFDSAGDIRFGTTAGAGLNILDSGGNLTFQAAQLYPTTGATMTVYAGNDQASAVGQAEFAGTLTVLGLGGAAPEAPFSVGGSLRLIAGTVQQLGVVRAPEGSLVLGNGDEVPFKDDAAAGDQPNVTASVTLGAGSVTSVSLDGLTVPYGGTLDGVNYTYAGSPVGVFDPVIVLQGQKVSVTSGATVDISGGGTLAGAGFIPGRGGSIDVNTAPLISSLSGTVAATSTDGVYAIVPGTGTMYAPVAPGNAGYATPALGAQITVAAGEVPGLAAGTYTLLPAYYDLLPGGFRVELGSTQLPPNFADAIGNFTTMAAVDVSTVNTGIASPVQQAALFTSGAGVRQLSQYAEESYNDFEATAAATFDTARPLLPQDAKTLVIDIDQVAASGQASLAVSAQAILQAPASGGYGATVALASIAPIEISSGGAVVTAPGTLLPVGVSTATLNALNAPRLVIGGTLTAPLDGVVSLVSEAPLVEILPGATLTAGDVMLSVAPGGTIAVSSGATISSIGHGTTALGLAGGYTFNVDDGSLGSFATLDVSNTQNEFVPAVSSAGAALMTVAPGAALLAGGSLNFVAPPGAAVQIAQGAVLGGKYVDLQVASIDIGTAASLSANAAILPDGFALDTAVLGILLDGDGAAGVPPALQLILTASQSVDILGSVALNTGATDLVLNTPAIYGFGAPADQVSIVAKDFTWSGISTVQTLQTGSLTAVTALPGGQIAGSASNIAGSLLISAATITLGYGPLAQPDDQTTLDRTIAGFADVTLQGTTEITANNNSALAVYAAIPDFGVAGTGGNLTLDTPLLTAASGSVLHLQAGGGFSLASSAGAPASTQAVTTLGAEIDVTAAQIAVASAVALPAGNFSLTADGTQNITNTQSSSTTSTTATGTVVTDTLITTGTITGASISLLAGADIDLSGRATKNFDQVVESPGGTLSLQSASGIVTTTTVTTTVTGDGPAVPSSQLVTTTVAPVANPDLTQGDDIAMAQGSAVDVAAPGANAGAISLSALGGTVDLEGTLTGSADAAHMSGSFTMIAGAFGGAGSFDQLDTLLDTGQFTGSRSFELATGNLLVDQTVQAHTVQIAADGGSLEVAATIDASGAQPGSIALSAGGNLTLDTGAVLDAHATGVARDSYGQDIDAENRAHVTLTSSGGTLTLAQGAVIDELYSTNDPALADGAQGQVVLNAPRAGSNDANFAASGPVTVQGAASVALVAWTAYAPGDANGTIVQDNGGTTPVSATGTVGLNQIDTASQAFMTAALAAPGPGLQAVAAALSASGSLASLLRPGVEIDSAAASGGNLTLSGDLNFAGFRYGPNANSTTGAGTPGVVLFRAANNLTVNGSVTDGFAAPPDSLPGNTLTADTAGWVVQNGYVDQTNADLLLPSSAQGTYKPDLKNMETTSQIELGIGTGFNTQRPISLNYAITIASANLRSNVVIPFSAILGTAAAPIPAGGWVATAPILSSSGAVLFARGALIPGGTVLQPGTVIQSGTVLPVSVDVFDNTVVPQGTPLDIFADNIIHLSADTGVLPADALIPSNTHALFVGVFAGGDVEKIKLLDLRPENADGVQGYLYPLAQMLPDGSQSWSMNFVAGANLGSADTLAVLPKTVLNAGGTLPVAEGDNTAPGSLLLDDEHSASSGLTTDTVAAFSVIRTGTGDLNLVAGGNFDQSSLFGIYTAGTQTSADTVGSNTDGFNAARYAYGPNGFIPIPGVLPDNGTDFPGTDIVTLNAIIASTYQANYPAGGGDVLVSAQGSVTGDVLGTNTGSGINGGPPSDAVGNWLWRQGSTQLGQPTAWWINFGTFVEPLGASENDTGNEPQLVGFQGIGALGGGNVTVVAGGNAGQITDRQGSDKVLTPRGEGLVVVVADTGRLALGASTPTLTGGGDITIDIGGTLNPIDGNAYALDPAGNGDVVDLRGNVSITAGAVGRIAPTYSVGVPGLNTAVTSNDPRPQNPFAQDNGLPQGGIVVVPGDGSVSITTDRDLVLQGAGDPGREPEQNVTAIDTSSYGTTVNNSGGFSGFSLWQADTAISLFSAGGSVTPTTVPQDIVPNSFYITNDAPTDYRSLYPPTLLVTAATGDIIYGDAQVQAFSASALNATDYSLETAPAPNGQVAFLAGGSIFANGYVIDMSGADPAHVSLPSDPAFTSNAGLANNVVTNIRQSGGTDNSADALFAFQADTPTTNVHQNDPDPALFYAAGGDIVNFQTGETLSFNALSNEPVTTWYIAAKPVWVQAAGDIVSSGVRPGVDPGSAAQENQVDDPAIGAGGGIAQTSGNLFLNTGPGSISVVSAGRDILSGYFYVGGPGLLEIDAGRNLYQAATSTNGTQTLDFGDIRSLGALISGAPVSLTGGADIAVLAGIGTGAAYTAFADLYFNPANQANLALNLSDPANAGKVQQVYSAQLLAWLQANHGYLGDQAGALAFFLALPQVQQDVFVRATFFDDLLASGRQYNDPASRFYHDYARGQLAIDTLFPSLGTETAKGVPAGYGGAITMYSGTVPGVYTSSTDKTLSTFDGGIATLFGGNVQVLDPGGQIELGIPGGPAPSDNSGIITYGSGDIDIYALGDVLLGKSRIFTTAGGNIEIWSSDGDINAGIGAKTTVAYNPPVLSYDDTGGITDTPTVPTNGAGIATLAPLPGIPAGDIDLIAPLGTIDAGEAGIRVSGNLNLAAARLANTSNISVGGKTTGTPTVTVASLGAVEAAGAAAGAASSAAQGTANRGPNDAGDIASVVEVDVIGIGGTYEEDRKRKKKSGG